MILQPTVKFCPSIEEIGESVWSNLVGRDNPFTRYEFLHALEVSQCTTARSGWKPNHLVVSESDSVLAIVPLYEKTNSYGEYVFDWAWASAYENNGFQYYPKLVTAVPFTPSFEKRLFFKKNLDSENQQHLVRIIFEHIKIHAAEIDASSWHVLFPEKAQQDLLVEGGLMPRIACQFHWRNQDYQSFDDFLAKLSSRKRKNIRKEREQVKRQGIDFEILEGHEIREHHWRTFHHFYRSTYDMRGMTAYLNLRFFEKLSITMPENLVLILATQDQAEDDFVEQQLHSDHALLDQPYIAGALFFKSSDRLFGRYWGALRDYPCLHFETCFYRGQEYCIANGLKTFDPGAQGEHKILRGFEPTKTYSSHWVANDMFARAIKDFLKEDAGHVERYIEQAKSLLPFKKLE